MSHQLEPEAIPTRATKIRVCDRCISKKVKCNLGRPRCSRCAEDDALCTYTSIRKKPGPPKNSRSFVSSGAAHVAKRAKSRSSRSSRSCGLSSSLRARLEAREPIALDQRLIELPIDFSSGISTVVQPSTVSYTQSALLPSRASSLGAHLSLQLRPEQENDLLLSFFDLLHPAIPLFRRDVFIEQHRHGTVKESLFFTVLAVTAKALNSPRYRNCKNFDTCLSRLLETSTADMEHPANSISLDTFREACLLAFYEFHSRPGEGAWMRIGQLTRKAYQRGLNQIDTEDEISAFDQSSISTEKLEEWRYVWWCIYCLDSYSNIASGTPFIIDNESVRTALATASLLEPTADQNYASASKIFLPIDNETLWQTVKAATNRYEESAASFAVHMITTKLLRESGSILRLWKQTPSAHLHARLAAFKNDLSAVRLALPSRYLNPSRNVLGEESRLSHHTRLVCVLHLHAANLLVCFPLNQADDLVHWQFSRNLEYCEDVVTVVREWDGQFSTAVDPAVCFISFLALIVLHFIGFHELSQGPELSARIKSSKDVLVLFLQQFELSWQLPRFLLASYDRISSLASGPMTVTEIMQKLRKMPMPLNSRWTALMSASSGNKQTGMLQGNSQSINSGDWDLDNWDLNNWEAMSTQEYDWSGMI